MIQRKQVPQVNKSQRSERLIRKQNVLREADSQQHWWTAGKQRFSPIAIPALSLLRKKKHPMLIQGMLQHSFRQIPSRLCVPDLHQNNRPFYNFTQATSGYLCRCGEFALSCDDKHRFKECCCAAGSLKSVCSASPVSLLIKKIRILSRQCPTLSLHWNSSFVWPHTIKISCCFFLSG